MSKPIILISNDDGIEANGIHALVDFVSEYGEVWVVAPDSHQSGKSSALTVDTPLRKKQHPDYNGAKMWSVNGTPVDCVKLALNSILPRTPDMILSGINHGANTGTSVLYSGTMGIAYEGCVHDIPSIGFSYLDYMPNADFTSCKNIVQEIVTKVMMSGLPHGICLNVNMPKGVEIKGIQVTKAARGMWAEEYESRVDPQRRTYYWLTGKYVDYEAEVDKTDLYWLREGYASVVPCHVDQTAFGSLNDIDALLNS